MQILIDTHCHLNHPNYFGDLPAVLRRMADAGVGQAICVGYDHDSSAQAVRLARTIKVLRASVGIHPHDADTFSEGMEQQIRKLADNECVVAIGESGLDYYRNLSPRNTQQKAFRRHIRMAHDLELPLIIHSREAHKDVLSILEDEGLPPRGAVMHCLPSDADFARDSLKKGCYLGIGGAVTFTNANLLREIVSTIPTSRLLLETDCPYLSPHPFRGKRNEPSNLPLIAEAVAKVLGISVQEIAERSTANAKTLFRL